MELNEYTLSPHVSDALQKAFEPFLARTIDGMPLADWLDRQDIECKQPFPDKALALTMANTLENVLGLDGGAAGVDLLHALDGIIHGGGNPALVIHGLPTDAAIAPILREAFRFKMYADPQKEFAVQLHMADQRNIFLPTGYDRNTFSVLHQDDADIGLLFGVHGGRNPRHTPVVPLSDYMERIAAAARAMGFEISADTLAELMAKPIWPLKVQFGIKSYTGFYADADRERIARATDANMVELGTNGRRNAPLIYPNPAYDAREPQSQKYTILHAPAKQFGQRMDPDMSSVPPALAPAFSACLKIMREHSLNDIPLKEGPVLGEGDLLVFNNRLVLHAGGPHVHDYLPLRPRLFPGKDDNRHVVSMDIDTLPPEQYPVRPGDRVTQPIHIGRGDVTLDLGEGR